MFRFIEFRICITRNANSRFEFGTTVEVCEEGTSKVASAIPLGRRKFNIKRSCGRISSWCIGVEIQNRESDVCKYFFMDSEILAETNVYTVHRVKS